MIYIIVEHFTCYAENVRMGDDWVVGDVTKEVKSISDSEVKLAARHGKSKSNKIRISQLYVIVHHLILP